MLNKRIMMSAFSIVTALTLAGGATFAFFTSTANSTGNTFTSGTLDLQVRDDDQGFANAVTTSIHSPSNWAPGESFQSFMCFRNNGSTPIQEILMKLTSSGNTAELAPFITAKKVELGPATAQDCQQLSGGTLADYTADVFVPRFDTTTGNHDGKVSLQELLAQVDGTNRRDDDLLNDTDAFLPAGGIVKFVTTWEFDTSANDTAQGKTMNLDMQFVANQDEVATATP
jgi:predicted ribosomally synthesized peptide with SipW-like signal peptide